MASRVRRPSPVRGEPSGPPIPLDLAERLLAIRKIVDAGPPVEADALLRGLSDPEPAIRRAAAWALGTLQEARGRGALEAALADPDPSVRGFAAGALAQLGRRESRPALEALIEDP